MLNVGSSRKLTLELFPFISLFLCVIGVLAFLQNLIVVGQVGAEEEEASQPQIYQTAFTIECFDGRFVLTPPDIDLFTIYYDVTLEELVGIRSIQQRRKTAKASGEQTMLISENFDDADLHVVLNEISTLNRLAKQYGLEYEEYVLLKVNSGGTDVYHYLSGMLDQTEFKHIRTGLDVSGPQASLAGDG